jgi:hypothetical protein
MAPPASATASGGMMHFSGYASFVPPSGFPPPNITMAVALKSEPNRSGWRENVRRVVRAVNTGVLTLQLAVAFS